MCIVVGVPLKQRIKTLEHFRHMLPLQSLVYKGDRVTAVLFQTECLKA